MKYFTLLSFCAAFMFFTSCGGDDPADASNCNTQFAQSFEDELEVVSQASQNFAMDPSSANCESFKQAYIDYLNALDDWEECANFYNQVDQWQQAIDAAQIAADNIEC